MTNIQNQTLYKGKYCIALENVTPLVEIFIRSVLRDTNIITTFIQLATIIKLDAHSIR